MYHNGWKLVYADDSQRKEKFLTFLWSRDNMIIEKECYR